ncbi:toprim domain-containing protein [Thermoactinomyces sp. DSM 45892]|uniref:toprim domain-containing protein n=1 Tax=Thermoactinomyces sp. DSM 45892 TaxID=1882753 RepID=UPI000895EC91|nr:toprim domain-containing protein [Thermoactinomyces sp. DSM 45892]SDZ05662.1 Toprim-like [Thermoactinomyces sp. DSM 45892]
MAYVKVRHSRVDVDIERELSGYYWHRERWTTKKLIACSPFRYDFSPSFFVSLSNGSWGDSGGTGEYKSGNFVKLLAYLRQETEYETEAYLLSEYAREITEEDRLKVDFSRIRFQKQRIGIPQTFLDRFTQPNDYLRDRGISKEIEIEMNIRYDPKRDRIVIPWYFPDGRLASVKYRHCGSKIFYYEKNGYPIRKLLYGMDRVYRKNSSIVVLVESEIDAMYIMSMTDYDAIALGTSRLSKNQVDLIARSSLEEVIIMADNDDAGREMREQAIKSLCPFLKVNVASIPREYKDANEIKEFHILSKIIENRVIHQGLGLVPVYTGNIIYGDIR